MSQTSSQTSRYGIFPGENVLETSEYRLWRGTRSEDALAVLVKESLLSSARQSARLTHEYEVMRSVRTTGVPEALSLSRSSSSSALIMRDGHPLRALSGILSSSSSSGLDIGFVLRLAMQLSETIGRVHRQGIVHAGITPRAILLTEEEEALLVDFSRSSLLSLERQEVKSGSTASTSGLDLRYAAPEQTGRMNRAVDWRTDMYSLGVVLYESLTGRLPFTGADAMELMHAHIAVKAVPPTALRSEIPVTVSEMVLKLLNKTAEERYQSGFGLKRDVAECLRQWESTGKVDVFAVGAQDVSDRFQLPQKLYGRESEVRRLLEVFDEAETGQGRLLLVKGVSGIGKSSLVQEIQKPIVRTRGYFVQGKFDQFKRDIPYSALSSAFGGLMRQIASEPESGLTWWRERLQKSLGNIGQVIVDIVPQLESIIGKQAPLPELGANETQNRFKLAMERFVRACSSAEHPLVLFLDDLQWADASSLEVLKVLTDRESAHVLVIGAYRDNEVDGTHLLSKTLALIGEEGGIIDEVSVLPLSAGQVRELVSDTVGRNDEETWKLSLSVHEKTEGNPFFVGEVLQTLYREGIIYFEESGLRWEWSLEKVRGVKLAGTVVELMVSRLETLPEEVREIVRLAACVGNEFRLGTLSVVAERSVEEVAGLLWEAAKQGFVVPIGEGYKYVRRGVLPEVSGNEEEYRFVHDSAQEAAYTIGVESSAEASADSSVSADEVGYQFAHDRVQQAAYGLIEASKRSSIHLKIGRLLLQNTEESSLDDAVFEIVRHMNEGMDLITERSEKFSLASLNTRAAVRAIRSTSYQVAYELSGRSVALLESEAGWTEAYGVTVSSYEARAGAAAYVGAYGEMDAAVRRVQEKARMVEEMVVATEIRITSLAGQNRLSDALQEGLVMLERLGVKLPAKPTQVSGLVAIVRTMVFTKRFLKKRGWSIRDLEGLPLMEDTRVLAQMRILTALIAIAYLAFPVYMPLLIAIQLRLMLTFGLSPQSSFALAGWGFILSGALNKTRDGMDFGLVGTSERMRALDKVNFIRSVTVVEGFLRHRVEDRRVVMQKEIEQALLLVDETGDYEYFGYLVVTFSGHIVSSGILFGEANAREVYHRLQSYEDGCRQRNTSVGLGGLSQIIPYVGLLSGDVEVLPPMPEGENKTVLGYHYAHSLLASSWLYRGKQPGSEARVDARALLEGFERVKDSLMGLPALSAAWYYGGLLCAEHLAVARGRERRYLWRSLKKYHKQLAQWSNDAPMNYGQRRDLLAAEILRLQGKDAQAEVMYDRAIDGARAEKWLNDESLANERAGLFYLARGKKAIARMYLSEARRLYSDIGAFALVARLEGEHMELLGAPIASAGNAALGAESGLAAERAESSSVEESGTSVDVEALSRASQAIAGEMEVESLLKKIMTVTLQSAGASSAALALMRGERLYVVAEADSLGARVLAETEVERSTTLPVSVLSQAARLSEVRIVGDVSEEAELQTNASLVSRGVQSLLCQPVMNQGKLVGVLYVENNAVREAFTPERTRVLSLLASQAAVSIENALLVSSMTKMERLKKEMEMAATIQLGMLPKKLPTIAGYESGAMLRMTREAGGDLYDIVPIGMKEYLLVVGDVSGKGMPAALYMSAALNVLRTEIACFTDGVDGGAEISPARLLKIVNMLMKGTMQPGNFITLFLGILNVETHELRYSSGGHDPCAKWNPAQQSFELLNTEGQACGAVGAKLYNPYVEEKRVRIAPGDYLVWNTDGITEAKDVAEGEYTDGRFWERVQEIEGSESPDAVLRHIVADVESFVGAAEQYDDMTLLCLKRIG